jgi:hypothetical protein
LIGGLDIVKVFFLLYLCVALSDRDSKNIPRTKEMVASGELATLLG